MSKTLSQESHVDHTRRELAATGRADQADQLDQEASAHLALLQQTNENITRLHAHLEQAGQLSGQLEEVRRLSTQLEQARHQLAGWSRPAAPGPVLRPNKLVRLLLLAGIFVLGAVVGPRLGEQLSSHLSTIDVESVRRWAEGVWSDTAYRLRPPRVVAAPLVSGDAGTGVGALGQRSSEPVWAPQEQVSLSAAEPEPAPSWLDAAPVFWSDESATVAVQPIAAEDARRVSWQSQAVSSEPAPPALLQDAERTDPWSGRWLEPGPEVSQPAQTSRQSEGDRSAPVPPAPIESLAPTESLAPANPQVVEPPLPVVESAPDVPVPQPPSKKTVEPLHGQFKI